MDPDWYPCHEIPSGTEHHRGVPSLLMAAVRICPKTHGPVSSEVLGFLVGGKYSIIKRVFRGAFALSNDVVENDFRGWSPKLHYWSGAAFDVGSLAEVTDTQLNRRSMIIGEVLEELLPGECEVVRNHLVHGCAFFPYWAPGHAW